MKFSDSLVGILADKNLLKHEWYQAWNCGKVPVETLRHYAKQYYHHVKMFPRYLSATHSNCEQIQARQFLLENLNDEEFGSENHPELWLRFAEGMGANRHEVESTVPNQEIQDLVDAFMGFSKRSYPTGLGALFAYEHQIPGIAQFKLEALKNHYSIDDAATLSFFDVHQKADVYHTEAISKLLDELTPDEQQAAETAARVVCNQLWKFLDGVQRTLPLQ